MARPVAIVLLVVITALSVGCQAYTVGGGDRDDFTLATKAVQDGLETIRGSKTGEEDLPEAQGLIDLLQVREAQITTALTQGTLDAEGGRNLRDGLAVYCDRYAELVESAINDGEHFELASSPEKQRRLRASAARVKIIVDRIDQRLDTFLVTDKQVTEQRIREAVHVLGAALIAYDEQCNHRLEQKLAKVPDGSQAAQRIRTQQHDIVQAIDGWLAAVDTQLKSMIATGKVEPTFLGASKLSNAIKLTFDPDEKRNWSQWTDVAITIAAASVEGLVPQAKTIGKDEQWALRIIEEEFAPLIQQYRQVHAIGSPG